MLETATTFLILVFLLLVVRTVASYLFSQKRDLLKKSTLTAVILLGGVLFPLTLSADAVDDDYIVTKDTAYSGNVLNNDSGDDMEVISNTSPSHGTLSGVNSDGSFTYTPNADYTGADAFDYTMTWCSAYNRWGNCKTWETDTAHVTLTVMEVVQNADDLCYEEPTTSGICVDLGPISGGINCTQTIPITNQGSDDLTNVSVVIDMSGYNADVFSECTIDGENENCEEESNIDMGPMGIFTQAINYDPMPDYAASDTHTISETSLVEGGLFSGQNLFGSYIKDGVLYVGEIQACDTRNYTDENQDECGIFPSVLTSYEGIITQKNDILNTCYISVTDYNLTEETSGQNDMTCYVDETMDTPCTCDPAVSECSEGSTCNITEPDPDKKLEYVVYETPIEESYTIDKNWDNDDDGATNVTGNDTDLNVTFYAKEYGSYKTTDDVSVVNFSPNSTYDNSDVNLMVLGDIQIAGNNQTLYFEGGDYYFNSFKIMDDQGNTNQATICPKEDIRLFVKEDFVYSGNHLNDPGCDGKIFIYVQGDATIDANGGGSNTIPMFLYTEGDVTIENSGQASEWSISITAEGVIDIPGENINFVYDDEGFGGYGTCCIGINFDRNHYNISEDINVIGTTETVYPVIVLDQAVSYDVTIDYFTIDGSATVADGDYVQITDGSVTIPAGETNVSIPVKIYNDAPIELDENFFVQLTNPQPDTDICLGDQNRTQINILAQEDSPVCFEDNFDNGLDSKWRVLKSSGDFIPHVVDVNGDARLRITPDETNIATVITKDYEFSTSQNLIIVEFDYYAYGGCDHSGLGIDGADGIVNVLFDSAVGDSPTPGSFGGSMGYAQRDNGDPGFEGGWLGLGIDEYGNFGNCNEGRIGGLPGTSCDYNTGFNPQYHRNTAVIRGDGNGTNGYEFLQGVEVTDTNLSQPKVADKAADDYFSGRYKMTIDARDPDHLKISLARDLGDGEGYRVIITEFDAKLIEFNQGETPEFVRYAISGGTGGGCNNHELSWIRLKGNCAAYGSQSYETGPFDAWDTFRNVSDKSISTKLTNGQFNLVLASMDETQSATELKTTADRVYYGLVKQNGEDAYTYVMNPLDQPALDFTTAETYTRSFNVSSAVADTKVVFRFCADYNGTTYTLYPADSNCTGQPSIVLWPDEQNIVGWREILSSDNFAVRPDHFTIDGISDKIVAGEDFNITIHAKDINGNDVVDYNETVNIWGASPTLDHNHTILDCQPDTRELNKVAGGFNDGIATITLNYNEVGDLAIALTEHPETDYAHNDFDDTDYNATTSDSQNQDGGSIYRQISTASTTLTFIPDHFEVNATFKDHHMENDANFTYISDDLDMATKLELHITAMTQNNDVAHNYIDGCYAKQPFDINLTLEYNVSDTTLTTPENLTKVTYRVIEIESTALLDDTIDALSGPDIDTNAIDYQATTTTIFPDSTHNGTSLLRFYINFDRTNNQPVNPFKLNVSDITVGDGDATGVNNTLDYNATYLFARAKSSKDFYDDVSDTQVDTPISVEVYCDQWPVSAEKCPQIDILNGQTNDYKWWISTKHSASTSKDGNITLKVGTISVATGSASVAPTSVNIDNSGGINSNVTVTNNSGTVPMTVDIDFDETNPTDTNKWLIYNPTDNTTPSPFYQVRFIGNMGWAGYGDTGHVVDSNSSTKKNRRLGW